jgi:uncharacterized protein YegL
MKADYTDITILLDRSGSMSSIKDDMVGGIKSFIEEQKKLPGQCRLSLVQFDGDAYETVFSALPLADTPAIKLVPRGDTPLLDSLGRCIDETGERIKNLDESERPEFVIFVVITDGQENASHKFSRAQIKEKVQHQIGKYNWHFTFLGANQDAFTEAAKIGIPDYSALTFKPNQGGIRCLFGSVGDKTSQLRMKVASVMAYSKADYDAQDKQ